MRFIYTYRDTQQALAALTLIGPYQRLFTLLSMLKLQQGWDGAVWLTVQPSESASLPITRRSSLIFTFTFALAVSPGKHYKLTTLVKHKTKHNFKSLRLFYHQNCWKWFTSGTTMTFPSCLALLHAGFFGVLLIRLFLLVEAHAGSQIAAGCSLCCVFKCNL